MRGEGQARLALSGFLLARTTKDQFHPRELLSSEGPQLIPGEAIVSSEGFLDQLLAPGALLLSLCLLLPWT